MQIWLVAENRHETLVCPGSAFDSQFTGPDRRTYDCFDKVRRELIVTIHNLLSPQDKAFLVSFKSGDPDWTLFPVAGIELLAAVQWKQLNIRKLKKTNFQ